MECQELKCCVCDQDYSDLCLPRDLSCGHSVCSICLDQLMPIGKRCPECRQVFKARSSSDLPINYSLLTLARMITFINTEGDVRQVQLPLSFPSSKVPLEAEKCPSHGNPMFFMCMRCRVWICRDCFQTDHPDLPYGNCFILSSTEAIDRLQSFHSSDVDECIVRANVFKEYLEFQFFVKQLQERLDDTSQAIWTQRRSQMALVETSPYLDTLEDLMKCLREAKENLLISSSPADVMVSVEAVTQCQTAVETHIAEGKGNPECEIMNIFHEGKKKLKELLAVQKPVYAVAAESDKVRWSLITEKEGLLYIYSLQDGLPPEDGKFYLPYNFVQKFVPKESQTIFLEVGWRGELKGEVHVGLFGDTPRSRQTLFLCSGEKGPSYRNTCFYRSIVVDNCRVLGGGDYENNDGTGGRAIVDGIVSGYPYTRNVTAGLFISWPFRETWRLGSFEVYLDDWPGNTDRSAHGMVEKGLDILREAANVTPVTDASVKDCGVVVPL